MKRAIFPFAAVFALGACTASQSDQAEERASEVVALESAPGVGFEAVAAGTYEIVRKDGSIDRLTVHPGLTWSMVDAKGNASGGTIFAQDGKNCFVTEGVEGHQCFLGSAPAVDGSIEVTGDSGEKATVRPVAAPATG